MYIYICYVQSTDSDHPRILLRKPRIRALRNNPRIAHANLGSEDYLRKPRIRGFRCANLGSARNHLGSRSQTSAIRGNKPTIDRALKATRPSTATWVRCSGWPSCFACAIDRGFVAADGRGLAARSQKIACGFEVYMSDPRIIAQKLGSEVCAAKS